MVSLIDITNHLSEEKRAQDRALAAMLTHWAGLAEKGGYKAIAIAAVCEDDTIDFEISGSDDHTLLIGATSILHFETIKRSQTVDVKPSGGDNVG